MKSKQYSVKVFECSIDDDMEFIEFFNTNYTLFKDHLIVINGDLSDKVKEYLNSKSLSFLQNVSLPKGRTRKALEDDLEAERKEQKINRLMVQSEMATLSKRLQNNLTVLNQMVRSGEDLKIDGDLLILNRVNSGATIYSSGNLIITELVEGAIRCDGNFMMLMVSPKANILFHGVEVGYEKFLKNRLTKVEFKYGKIIITPVFKKEINWVL